MNQDSDRKNRMEKKKLLFQEMDFSCVLLHSDTDDFSLSTQNHPHIPIDHLDHEDVLLNPYPVSNDLFDFLDRPIPVLGHGLDPDTLGQYYETIRRIMEMENGREREGNQRITEETKQMVAVKMMDELVRLPMNLGMDVKDAKAWKSGAWKESKALCILKILKLVLNPRALWAQYKLVRLKQLDFASLTQFSAQNIRLEFLPHSHASLALDSNTAIEHNKAMVFVEDELHSLAYILKKLLWVAPVDAFIISFIFSDQNIAELYPIGLKRFLSNQRLDFPVFVKALQQLVLICFELFSM